MSDSLIRKKAHEKVKIFRKKGILVAYPLITADLESKESPLNDIFFGRDEGNYERGFRNLILYLSQLGIRPGFLGRMRKQEDIYFPEEETPMYYMGRINLQTGKNLVRSIIDIGETKDDFIRTPKEKRDFTRKLEEELRKSRIPSFLADYVN